MTHESNDTLESGTTFTVHFISAFRETRDTVIGVNENPIPGTPSWMTPAGWRLWLPAVTSGEQKLN
jgi:hypothetical protein